MHTSLLIQFNYLGLTINVKYIEINIANPNLLFSSNQTESTRLR